MSSELLHEDRSILGPDILDRHRAISTLMEELQAIDWYDQRIKACDNLELRAILSHNRNEEVEHASMLLEWLRRHDAAFDQQLKKYLFTHGPIRDTGAAPAATQSGAVGTANPATTDTTTDSLAIGGLRAAGG